MLGAALLAERRRKGLASKPWVKTMYGAGSQGWSTIPTTGPVAAVLGEAGTSIGSVNGCTTGIGNFGPPPEGSTKKAGERQRSSVAAVLSLNRQFPSRIDDVTMELVFVRHRWSSPTRRPGRWTRFRFAAAGDDRGRQRRVPQGHLPAREKDVRHHRLGDQRGDVHQERRSRVQGRRNWRTC